MSSGKSLLVPKEQTERDAFWLFWPHEARSRRQEKDLALRRLACAGKMQLSRRQFPQWLRALLQEAESCGPRQDERPPQRPPVGRHPKSSAEIVQARAISWAPDATAHKPLAAQHRWYDIFVHNDLGSYVDRARRKELYSGMRLYSSVLGEVDEGLIEWMKYLRATVRETERAKPSAPWELDSTRIDIVETYAAEVVGEDGQDYLIEFADYDGGTVEARLGKCEFEDLPYPVEDGTYFGIVVYRRKDQRGTTASVWPVAEYWHPTLRELPDAE